MDTSPVRRRHTLQSECILKKTNMNIRVKFGEIRKPVNLVHGTETTLHQLKSNIAIEFNSEHVEFMISLNGKDVLEGNDKMLSEFGLVNGDLVFAMTANGAPGNMMNEKQKTSKSIYEFPSTSANFSFVSKDNIEKNTEEQGCHESYKNMDASSVEFKSEQSEIDKINMVRCLKEPLLCRESTEAFIPATLSQIYSQTKCTDKNDALWLVIHILMMESGFSNVVEGTSNQQTDKCIMPDGWKSVSHYSGEYYHVVLGSDITCRLIGISMGSKLVINGKISGSFETKQIYIKSAEYVRSLQEDGTETYRNLHRLSRLIKDAITLPLLQELNTALGLPQVFGFLGLNFELKLKIFSYLDCASLVRFSETCKHVNSLHKDPYLWRRLHLTTFGGRSNTDLSQDWYEIYKQKYKARKEFYKRMQQSTIISPHYSWHQQPRPYPPFAPIYPHHGILGGDYDLNPQFPRIPESLRRRGHSGSGLEILHPRYDPIGPQQDPGLLQESGRNNNANHHWFGRAMGNRFL